MGRTRNRNTGNPVSLFPTKKRKDVHSIDFDGCFGPSFKESDSYCDMAEHNPEFIAKLVSDARASQLDEIIFLVGSSRQSRNSDLQAMMQEYEDKNESFFVYTGSCFVEIEKFVSNIQKLLFYVDTDTRVTLDKFLLADVAHALRSGETFSTAMREYGHYLHGAYSAGIKNLRTIVPNLYQEQLKSCASISTRNAEHKIFFDESKFALLYAQLHKMALENPNDNIHFHFYDDRFDILNDLSYLFGLHPELLPANVTLHLHPYIQGCHTNQASFQPIKGTGTIDQNYRDAVLHLRKISANLSPEAEKNVFVIDNLAQRFIQKTELEVGIKLHSDTPLFQEFLTARAGRSHEEQHRAISRV